MALDLSCFSKILLERLNYSKADFNFIIVTWIILGILMVKVSRELIKRIILNLITREISGPPELLMHKITAIKQLGRKEKQPNTKTEKYNLTYLLNNTKDVNIINVFSIARDTSITLEAAKRTKEEDNKIFIKYLETLCTKFPENTLIKLYLIQLNAKDWELYPKAIKVFSNLKLTRWSLYYLSLLFLRDKIEKTRLSKQENNTFQLDLVKYIESQSFIEDLKKEMSEQVDLRLKVCNNILGEVADIGEIIECAQSIDKSKKQIQKKIILLSRKIPDYYVEPLLLCAQYHLAFNYSVPDFKKYTEMYAKKCSEYEKHFNDLSLRQENIFQTTTAFLILLGENIENGRIVYCNGAIRDICGGEARLYEGSSVSRLFTPTLQTYYRGMLRQIFEKGHNSILNKLTETFLYHKEHYILMAEIYLAIHPFLNQSLYLDMIIRPVPTNKEYILIKENGDIEGATKNLCQLYGINTVNSVHSASSININIKMISKELYKASEAFNIIYKTQIADKMNRLFKEEQELKKTSRGFIMS